MVSILSLRSKTFSLNLNWFCYPQLTYFIGVTYLVSDLAPNTTYLIRVASRNPAGLSDWIQKEFRTHPKAAFSDASHSVSYNVPMSLIHLVIVHIAFGLFSPYEWNMIPFLD